MSEATPLWTMSEVVAATQGSLAATGSDWQADGVSIDSRTCAPGDLFIALSGPNFDGHDFVGAALEGGAAAAIVRHMPGGVAASERLVVVGDCGEALTALGRHARRRTSARIACITGSVGKTGTKEALALALSAQGVTHATAGNLNNQIGLPLTLARMPQDAAFGVLEIGMNHAGEITPLSQLAEPNVAIITTIAAVHLEFFDSVADIAEAKAEIFASMGPDGVAVLNRDNAYFATLATSATAQGIGQVIGFGAHPEAEARLVSGKFDASGSDVTAAIGGRTLRYRLNVAGRHWAINSLAVLAAVGALGGDVEAAAAALAGLKPGAGRGLRHIVDTGDGAFTVIDDSYNASPASMRAAIAVLGDCEPGAGGRRIAILGDMLELGDEGEQLHAGLAGDLAENNVAAVHSAGPLMAALDTALPNTMRGIHADTAEALCPQAVADIRPGDVVLVKGSLGSRMKQIVEALCARGTLLDDDPAEASHAV